MMRQRSIATFGRFPQVCRSFGGLCCIRRLSTLQIDGQPELEDLNR